jgi:hypothetical protein
MIESESALLIERSLRLDLPPSRSRRAVLPRRHQMLLSSVDFSNIQFSSSREKIIVLDRVNRKWHGYGFFASYSLSDLQQMNISLKLWIRERIHHAQKQSLHITSFDSIIEVLLDIKFVAESSMFPSFFLHLFGPVSSRYMDQTPICVMVLDQFRYYRALRWFVHSGWEREW